MRGASGQLILGWSCLAAHWPWLNYAFLMGWETSRSKARQGMDGTLRFRVQQSRHDERRLDRLGHALNRPSGGSRPSDQRCSAQCDLTWTFQNKVRGAGEEMMCAHRQGQEAAVAATSLRSRRRDMVQAA